MFIAILWGIFAGAATVETVKYQECVALAMKPETCHFEKKLKELEPHK